MRHTFACPMRWADMDLLGHVNNVTYLDYLQEARIALLAAAGVSPALLADGVVVTRHEVQFLAPLVYRPEPVLIDCWVSEIRAVTATTTFEVYDEDAAGRRTVYLRASTVLSPYDFAEERPRRLTADEKESLGTFTDPGFERTDRIAARPASGSRHVFEIPVRWSDVDAYRHVNNVKYIEFLQESRVHYLQSLRRDSPDGSPWSPWVVAQTDIDYLRPMLFRTQPYAVHGWVERVGTTSAVLTSEICDGDAVLARGRVVMVGFDKSTQRAAPMEPGQRQRLLAEVTPAS